jgi:hypothetical protein
VTVTSRVPAVIDYLVTAFQASPLLGGASPAVAVYDGPAATAAPDQAQLWVGLDDPDSAAATTAAGSVQAWGGLGHMAKNEQIAIHCVAQAWSGGDDVRTARQNVYAVMAAVEQVILADASLGGTVTAPGNASVSAAQLLQITGTPGAGARITFEITAQARIGG